ncbi:MAG: hypothetical protein VX346_28165 [Planctomycetota bacterium]|nr:hypothetical protein [Planctomycetota bacterium]
MIRQTVPALVMLAMVTVHSRSAVAASPRSLAAALSLAQQTGRAILAVAGRDT